MLDTSAVINSLATDFGKQFDEYDPEHARMLVEQLVQVSLADDDVDPLLQDALNNHQLDAFRVSFVERILDSELPEATKSELLSLVNQVFGNAMVPNVDPAFQAAVDAKFGPQTDQEVKDFWDLISETLEQMHAEEIKKQVAETPEKGEGGAEAAGAAGGEGGEAGGAEGAGGGAEGAGGGGGDAPNWLVALARAMGETQVKWADRMQASSDQMVATADADEKSAFIKAQNDFAAYARLFAMASEQSSTAIKSVGDGLTSVARKQ